MMLELGDDGVFKGVSEEELVYVDKNVLEELLNRYDNLVNENEDLKNNIGEQGVKLDFAICETQDFKNKWLKLKKENEQLAKEKERYKRLSEIRREEINNRIITIKEFIENCSDNKVKEILKDLFYSEVKEYDLSAQNRKLLHENEQLKKRLIKLKEENVELKEENEKLWCDGE